jgi:small-conductance mechanosensitive channel
MIGSFVFATHTTVCSGTLWYQIPRYLLLELPRLKNPSAKIFPFEIRRSPPSLMVWFVFKESRDVEDEKFKINMFNQKTIRRIKFKI